MAGYCHLSLQQFIDQNAQPMSGALLYLYDASTSDPITPYSEYSLATPLPNPVTADGFGRFPAIYLDNAVSQFYRARATDADGVAIFDLQTAMMIAIADGGGGGSPPEPVEATAVFATGDIKIRYDTSQITGWRICNGQTMGSATSGANYANDAAQPLYEFLWPDTSLVVVGGRGASAAADWAANKRLTLPDYRGYALVGRDGMGNSAANRVAALVNLGDRTGAATITLTEAQLPSVSKTVSTTTDGNHGHPAFTSITSGGSSNTSGGIMLNQAATSVQAAYTGTADATAGHQIGGAGAHDHDVTVTFGSGSAHDNVQPSAGITVYIKL